MSRSAPLCEPDAAGFAVVVLAAAAAFENQPQGWAAFRLAGNHRRGPFLAMRVWQDDVERFS